MGKDKPKTELNMAVDIVNAIDELNGRKDDLIDKLNGLVRQETKNENFDIRTDPNRTEVIKKMATSKHLNELNKILAESSKIDQLKKKLEDYLPFFGYVDKDQNKVNSYDSIPMLAEMMVQSQIDELGLIDAKINREMSLYLVIDVFNEMNNENAEKRFDETGLTFDSRTGSKVEIPTVFKNNVLPYVRKAMNLNKEEYERMYNDATNAVLKEMHLTINGEKPDVKRFNDLKKYASLKNDKKKSELFNKLVKETEQRLYAERGLTKRALHNNPITRVFAQSTLERVKPLVKGTRIVRRKVKEILKDVASITVGGIGKIAESVRNSFETAGIDVASKKASGLAERLAPMNDERQIEEK